MRKDIALVVAVNVDAAELPALVEKLTTVFNADCLPYIQAVVGDKLIDTYVDDEYSD
jgi:hypothetical protein